MKKLLLATMMVLVTATPAMAACEGGTEQNGICMSNISLNWWSAANWCKANGRHLVTMYEVCPDWDGNRGKGCPVIASTLNYPSWTATADGGGGAFHVNPSTGDVNVNGRQTTSYRALCK